MSALDAGLLIGDDGVVAHLGAGCRDRQDNTYRQACRGFSLLDIEIPHVALLGIRDTVADRLCGIDDRAAADGKDKVNTFFFAQFNALVDQAQVRVGDNAAQRDMADSLCIQRCTDPVDQTGADRALAAVVDQDLPAALCAHQRAQSVLSAFSEDHFCRCIVIKICSTNHSFCPFLPSKNLYQPSITVFLSLLSFFIFLIFIAQHPRLPPGDLRTGPACGP